MFETTSKYALAFAAVFLVSAQLNAAHASEEGNVREKPQVNNETDTTREEAAKDEDSSDSYSDGETSTNTEGMGWDNVKNKPWPHEPLPIPSN
jgi:hypothetical protein